MVGFANSFVWEFTGGDAGILRSLTNMYREEGAAKVLDRHGQQVAPGDQIYEGMVVGIHARGNDLVVNPLKAKQLTNIRAAGSDENILLTPPIRFSLEQALEFIDDDELVEVTPKSIRIRKKLLKESDRRRASRQAS